MQNKWREIEDNEDLKREFRGYKQGLVRFGPAGWCFAPGTAEMVSKYQVCKEGVCCLFLTFQLFQINFINYTILCCSEYQHSAG